MPNNAIQNPQQTQWYWNTALEVGRWGNGTVGRKQKRVIAVKKHAALLESRYLRARDRRRAQQKGTRQLSAPFVGVCLQLQLPSAWHQS